MASSFIPDQASDINVDTTDLNNGLSSLDRTVQLALETIDEYKQLGLYFVENGNALELWWKTTLVQSWTVEPVVLSPRRTSLWFLLPYISE